MSKDGLASKAIFEKIFVAPAKRSNESQQVSSETAPARTQMSAQESLRGIRLVPRR